MAKQINTKEKIMKTAYKMFSEHGYRDTTIRMIADAAKVNVASVNYHFSGKEELYLSVVRRWAEEAFEYFPLDLIEDNNKDPKERIELFIFNTLLCLFGKDGQGTGFGQLMILEASISPSKVVHQVVTETIQKPTEGLGQAVKEYTGVEDDEQVRFQTACIVGQTVYFFLSRYLIKDLFQIGMPQSEADIKNLSKMIYQITLTSLNGLRSEMLS